VTTLRPFPSPLQAALLTLMASFLAGGVALAASESLSPTAAIGLGTVVGFCAAGALGAASIPPPHGERVGLRGLALRHLPALLLLLPVALLASEVDNVAKALFVPPDTGALDQAALEKLPTRTELALVETAIVAVGLVPLVEEWFFRGIVQQGLVATAGPVLGVFWTALLFALGHGAPGASWQAWVAMVAQAFVLGGVLGFARHATGSVLAPVLVHCGVNALGVLSLAAPGLISIPGYDASGAHTPAAWLVPSAIAVALGLALLARERPAPAPPLPPAPVD
jgi:membrane protease YdiL (CAAX protease family)